jgi:hypothetical protein
VRKEAHDGGITVAEEYQKELLGLLGKVTIIQAYEIMRLETFNHPHSADLTAQFLYNILERSGNTFSETDALERLKMLVAEVLQEESFDKSSQTPH